MVGLQTLDLAIGVRVPASQPLIINAKRVANGCPFHVLWDYLTQEFEMVNH